MKRNYLQYVILFIAFITLWSTRCAEDETSVKQEKNPNNTYETATPLELENDETLTISKTLYSKSDKDYYKVKLRESVTYDIILTPPVNKRYYLKLFDYGKSELSGTRSTEGNVIKLTFTADETIYHYILVYTKADFSKRDKYKLSIQRVETPISTSVESITFTPPEGSFSTAQSVTFSTTTTGATIRYTTNGTDPTCTTGIEYTGAINIPSTQTIKAIGCITDWSDSPISTATYTISDTESPTVGGGGTVIRYPLKIYPLKFPFKETFTQTPLIPSDV